MYENTSLPLFIIAGALHLPLGELLYARHRWPQRWGQVYSTKQFFSHNSRVKLLKGNDFYSSGWMIYDYLLKNNFSYSEYVHCSIFNDC
jgi:hypothetical protein